MNQTELSYQSLSDYKVERIAKKYYEKKAVFTEQRTQPIALFVAGQSGAGQLEQGQHIQSYKLGNISIAVGDYLTLQQDCELKTGWFKKLRIAEVLKFRLKRL